jgi:hypothetical protein
MSDLLVELGKSGNEIRGMLMQVYRDNAMKKTAVHKWEMRFFEGRENVTDCQQQAELKKTLQEFVKLCVTERETVRKILTEDLDMRKVYAKMVPKELTEEHCVGGSF